MKTEDDLPDYISYNSETRNWDKPVNFKPLANKTNMKTQEEIEQLADKWYTEKHQMIPSIIEQKSFIDGYTQCQEDNKEKKYTEDEIRNVMMMAWINGQANSDCHYSVREQWIEKNIRHLQPETSWEVEWETIDNRQPCDCSCHNNPNMIHFVACCNDGWIGKITQKLKLK